jgi:hypothetical protein
VWERLWPYIDAERERAEGMKCGGDHLCYFETLAATLNQLQPKRTAPSAPIYRAVGNEPVWPPR